MHSLVRENKDEWIVARYEVDNGTTCSYPLFHKLSLTTALELISYLNGGTQSLDDMKVKVLAMCAC